MAMILILGMLAMLATSIIYSVIHVYIVLFSDHRTVDKKLLCMMSGIVSGCCLNRTMSNCTSMLLNMCQVSCTKIQNHICISLCTWLGLILVLFIASDFWGQSVLLGVTLLVHKMRYYNMLKMCFCMNVYELVVVVILVHWKIDISD